MVITRVAVFTLSVSIWSAASGEASYRLVGCSQFKDGVSVGFSGPRGEKRRMHLSPRGVQLAGDVKGFARLSQVKELVLLPTLEITYTSGFRVQFGPIDAQCQQLFREVGTSLVHIKA